MSRPGPRPYECVRRAWHSDRLQPVRGLVIQQIFRLVHENHSAATKKNKEWQEKLPIVVLKAEEIMYSKANSEMARTQKNKATAHHLGLLKMSSILFFSLSVEGGHRVSPNDRDNR